MKSAAICTDVNSKTSACGILIVPLCISFWSVTATGVAVVNVFDFESALVLSTVTSIFTLWPLKFAPKSKVNCLPVGDPPKANIGSPSWLLPDKLKTSPTEPVPPEPVVIMVTVYLAWFNPTKVSFVPAVNVVSPLDDNVAVSCFVNV